MGDLLQTVSSLTALGFAGVGVVVFLLLFILLARGKPIDTTTASLYSRFLSWGVGFAVFCGVASIATAFITGRETAAKPRSITVAFNPNFDTRKLPRPKILLADGSTPPIARPFEYPGGMIQIDVEEAMSSVSALQQTAQRMTVEAGEARQERDKAVEALTQDGGGAARPPAGLAQLEASSAEAARIEGVVADSIRRGDFARASVASAQLRRPALQSSRALETVIARD